MPPRSGCNPERPNILIGVAFLTTRVREPDKDDDNKMGIILKYLISTRDILLTLESNSTGTVKWWVDAASVVHQDMKIHTEGMISMVRGAMYSASNKQKMNTKRYTEADMVGVYDIMPQIVWVRYFLEAQLIKVYDNVVFQDKQSTMKLEENGRASIGKQTRLINIRYYFVTDRIQSNEMKVDFLRWK